MIIEEKDLKPKELPINKIIHGNCLTVLKKFPSNSIDCVITSPPYNIGIDYDGTSDLKSWGEYHSFLEEVLKELYRVLKFGGRLCLVIGLGSANDRHPTDAYIIVNAEKVGFKHRDRIVWYKKGVQKRTAWGTYKSARCPFVTTPCEFIIVFSKGDYRKLPEGESDIEAEEFQRWTYGFWDIGHIKKVYHPAEFPVEIPLRLIKLYTYVGDIVLDPFAGSGTTAVACILTRRKFVCIDISEKYCRIAEERIKPYLNQASLEAFV